jgi:hypothetical protein
MENLGPIPNYLKGVDAPDVTKKLAQSLGTNEEAAN